MLLGRAGLFVAIFIWSGCASVQVVPVQNETGSEGRVLGHEAGVRFYRPAPYVWITALPREKKGDPVEYEAKIVVLPDFSQEYAIQWKTGLGSVNPRFELTDGWNLTDFNSRADSAASTVVREATGAVVELGSAIGGRKGERLEPGLYRLEVDEKGDLRLGNRAFGLE